MFITVAGGHIPCICDRCRSEKQNEEVSTLMSSGPSANTRGLGAWRETLAASCVLAERLSADNRSVCTYRLIISSSAQAGALLGEIFLCTQLHPLLCNQKAV